MNERNGKHWSLLIITLVIMFGGSLLEAWVQMGADAAEIREVRFYGSYIEEYIN